MSDEVKCPACNERVPWSAWTTTGCTTPGCRQGGDDRDVIAALSRELQQAAAENAAVIEHARTAKRLLVDGARVSRVHDELNAIIDQPYPRAAQLLAALDAARLAYAVTNPTATGADLKALTDLGRKLAALVSHE